TAGLGAHGARAAAPEASKNGPQDDPARVEGAQQRARDLGAAYALPVAHRDLGHAKAVLERGDLHLDGPAEAAVAHAERHQGAVADGPKGTEIGVAIAVKEMNERGGKAIAEALDGRERAALGPAQGAR